jgi:hypothetical protein
MLHVLVELYRLIYSHINRDMTEFELKKKIIGNSLYGVDVMPWAVHSAELRLWLQLIIEEDIPYANRKLFPLLPNLNLKLRVGDSLVQEVGGISLHVRDTKLSNSIKRRLTSLKSEKEKYYNNDPLAKFKSEESLRQEELRIFGEILDDKIVLLQKDIQNLEIMGRQEQFSIFEEDLKIPLTPPFSKGETIKPHFSKGGKGGIWPALNETARFVMLKKPFEEAINTKNLLAIEKADTIQKTEAYRVYPVKQETLLEEGWEKEEDVGAAPCGRPDEDGQQLIKQGKIQGRHKQQGNHRGLPLQENFIAGKYEGNKWGGKYLRAPDIFFTILEKGKGKLVRLGDIAEVRRGFTTGCNEFFYLPSKHFDIKKDGKYYELIPKYEGLPKGMKIEEEYLKPVVFSLKEIESIEDTGKLMKHKALIVSPEKISTYIKEYIKFGEEMKYHQRPTCNSRNNWFELPKNWKAAPFIFPAKVGERMLVLNNVHMIYEDKKLYGITPHVKNYDVYAYSCTLNSTWLRLYMDLTCRQLTGAQAIADIDVNVVENIYLINPELFDKKKAKFAHDGIKRRKINSCFTELGINPARPIREQKPNPLPDRKALDDIVFDILGLTEDERNEVYWAVCELVKNRLNKARSV